MNRVDEISELLANFIEEIQSLTFLITGLDVKKQLNSLTIYKQQLVANKNIDTKFFFSNCLFDKLSVADLFDDLRKTKYNSDKLN